MPSYFNQVYEPNAAITASLREIITDVRNAFLSCSFVRTVQSGSIDNISTIIPRTTTGQITYDIFAFNDVLQSTSPLFIRIGYLQNGTTNANLTLSFQMGKAHNDSGSLTGIDTLTQRNTSGYTNVQTNISASSIYASGDGGYMTLAYMPEAAYGQLTVFERLYNSVGVPTGDGHHMIAMSTDGNGFTMGRVIGSQMALNGKLPSAIELNALPNSRPSRVPATYDGRLVLGLIYPMYGRPYNPTPNLLLGTSNDFPRLHQRQKYTVYGTERTYVALGSVFENNDVKQYTNGAYLMRYDV